MVEDLAYNIIIICTTANLEETCYNIYLNTRCKLENKVGYRTKLRMHGHRNKTDSKNCRVIKVKLSL